MANLSIIASTSYFVMSDEPHKKVCFSNEDLVLSLEK